MPPYGDRSDVYSNEVNDSFSPRIISTTMSAYFGASREGPVGWKRVSSFDDFTAKYGKPNPAVGMFHYSVWLGFLYGAGSALVNRVVAADAYYGGLALSAASNVVTRYPLTIFNPGTTDDNGQSDMSRFLLRDGMTALQQAQSLLIFYLNGPGGRSADYDLELISPNLSTPVITSGSVATAFTPTMRKSSLAAGSVSYAITAYNVYGETAAATTTVTVTAGQAARMRIDAPVPGALGYRVYRTDANGTVVAGSFLSPATEFEDYGATVTTGSPPVASTIPVQLQFTINIYDKLVSTTSPVKTYSCTLGNSIDSTNTQTEIEQVINTDEGPVKVINQSAGRTDTVLTSFRVTLPAGSSGSVIPDTAVIAELEKLKDTDKYEVAALAQCGYTVPSVTAKMAEVILKRKRGLFFLDTPASRQEAASAVSFRMLDLNVNSNRGALFCNDHWVTDPYSGQQLWVPGSGIATGLIAFTDRVTNPAYSPAGFNRGLVAGTIKLRHNYSDDEKDMLARANINYFSSDRDYGVALRECYTLAKDFSAFSYIPVRRILDVAEIGIASLLKRYLQEPNNDLLNTRILSAIRQLLTLMKNENMIADFAVIGRTAANEVALGNRFCYSMIEPLIPNTRIVHNTILTKQGVDFTTEIQSLGLAA